FPGTSDLAIGTVIHGSGRSNVADGSRFDDDLFESHGCGIALNPRQVTVKPFHNVAQHEVILGVGAVPTFGEAGGAFGQNVAIAGSVAAAVHVEDDVRSARIGKSADQVVVADVASR